MTTLQERPTEPGAATGERDVRKAVRDRVRREIDRRNQLPPRKPRTPLAGAITWALIALSLVTLWFFFYALVLSGFQEAHNQTELYAQLRENFAGETAPIGGTITPGTPVALMSMPSAGINNLVVVEGTAPSDLMNGPGHRRDTPLPGQSGVSLVYGRSTTFGGPFGDIASASPGDKITVTTQEGESTYIVGDVRHVGDPYPSQLTAGAGRLTLVTSEGSGWRGGWASNRAVYVDANLQTKPYANPGGAPTYVTKSEMAMHGDVGSLFVLVLWLPVLVLAAMAVVWASARWGRWQTWVVGVPVVIAALWGVSQTAVQLLPNLL